ncbi:MAG: ATP-binding cassette domain-containing protein [Candidatus Limnocylindrales bacterium]
MTITGSTDGLALATRGLHKSYGNRPALAGLDLSVPAGVVYGFLGPNGAGKTTTMRLLTGLIHPDAGRIEMLGKPFGRRDRHRLFEVGALIESPSFYPYLSGRENIRALAATGPAVRKGRVDEVLDVMGLHDRAGDAVSGYSLGMRQRLGIAGVLLNDPKLLLLDEPANGLDPAGIVAIRDTLRYLASTGKTVFVSSHLLGEVQQLADQVGIIAAGKLVREGKIGELLESEGIIRVRVAPEETERATAVLGRLLGVATVQPTAVASDPQAVAATDPPAAAVPVPQAAAGGAQEAHAEPIRTDGDWLVVRLGRERAMEVNRTLAEAGIYASGLETGSDLESLFLELTTGVDAPGAATQTRRRFGGSSGPPGPPVALPGDWGQH